MIKSSQKFLYLILAINLVLLSGVSFSIWEIREESAELVAKQSSGLSAPDADLLARQRARLEPQMADLNSQFVLASSTISFLEKLENTAKISKVKLKINEAESKDNLRLNLSVEGSFSAVNQFLVILEELPYALRIERLDLRLGEKNVWRGDFVIIVATQNK